MRRDDGGGTAKSTSNSGVFRQGRPKVYGCLNGSGEGTGMLAIERLKVNYGETRILFDVNLKVAEGEIRILVVV